MKKLKSIVLLLVTVFVFGLIMAGCGSDEYDKNIKILNEGYPTDIIIHGQDIVFRESLTYRKVDKITESTFETDKLHQIVVVNDLDDSVSLTDEEWLIIKSKTLDGAADFYYLGRSKVLLLKELGFWDVVFTLNEKECLSLLTQYGRKVPVTISWGYDLTEENISESLGNSLVHKFVNELKNRYSI